MSARSHDGTSADVAAETARGDAILYAFRRNVVVAASAGTGKTYRLTALYVLLALGLTSRGQPSTRHAAPELSPERIVATTFSRAAAGEIGRRIERVLGRIAAWDGRSPLELGAVIEARQAELGLALAPAELRRRAAAALARFPAARIDTLHGVAQSIVAANALGLGVVPGSKVLDEDEGQALADLAIDDALGDALRAGGEQAAAARDLLDATGGAPAARGHLVRLFDRLDEEGLGPRDLALADHAAGARETLDALFAAAARLCADGSAGVREAAGALGRARAHAARDGHDPLGAPAVARAAMELVLWPGRLSKKNDADDAFAELRRALPGKTHGERAAKLGALLCEAPRLAAREARLVDLLEAARARLLATRRRARALSFGDLLRAARDGLRDRPELARAVRASIDVLLVDEFQDTSGVQRDLVYLLRAREAAARPGVVPRADEVEPHGLFVVGDRKQSIYGFRGADVSIFCRVCADLAGSAAREALGLPEAPDAPSPSADFVALRESRRSGPRVLAFVNAFAARDFGMDRAPGDAPREYDVAYGAAERLCPVEREGGPRDEVILVDDRAAPDASRDPTALGGARPPAPGPAREALAAAAFVAREVRAGGHGTAWRDVAVLARRRSTIPFVELALARLRVPYVVAGRALYDAPEIRDVAALLRLLLDPRDRRALATVLRGPMVSLSEAGLAALAVPGRGLSVPLLGRRPRPEAPGAAALELLSDADRARLEAARARFPDVRAAALRMTPGEAIRHAVRAFELDRVLAALPRADARLGNVDRLVGIARRRGGTLASFARWLERRIDQDADEAEAAVFSPEDDAVRITTVHASKGLDFPVVVLVDLNAEPRGEVAPVGFAPATRAAPATLVVKHVGRPPHAGALAGAPPGEPDPFDGRELVVLPTAAVRDEQLEARSREAAERRRLTYVAMTRARSVLALVAPAAPPRARSAWRTLAGEPTADDDDLEAAVAPRLDPELAPHVTRVVDAAALAVEAASALDDAAPPPPGEVRAPPTPARPSSPARVVALATTPLALFHGCPRRFRLRALLGLEEPVSSGQLDLFGEPDDDAGAEDARALEGAGEADPRALGRAAHRVLERWPAEAWGAPTSEADVAQRLALEGLPATSAETQRMAEGLARFLGGPYARGLRAAGATLDREEPFVLPLAPAAPAAAALALRGAMDLVVTHPDGSIDVVDYKRSRPRADLGPYAFQLRAYALEARRRSPGRPIRAGIVFLGAAETPAWLPGAGPGGALSEAEHERFAEELADLARRFAEARWSDRFDGVAFDACRRLRCGFVAACHR